MRVLRVRLITPSLAPGDVRFDSRVLCDIYYVTVATDLLERLHIVPVMSDNTERTQWTITLRGNRER